MNMRTAVDIMLSTPGNTYELTRPSFWNKKSATDARQVLPNDDREQERLDILHHVFRLTLGGALCRTKLVNPQKILDIGTGTGIWAIESENLSLCPPW